MTNPSISWKRGDYCIAKYNDNEFYRARIIEVPKSKIKIYTKFFYMSVFLVTKTPDLYDVVYLDFGNWNKVASTDIHILLRKFSILTAQAIPCSLTKVNKFSKLILIYFRNFRVYLEVVLGLIIQKL